MLDDALYAIHHEAGGIVYDEELPTPGLHSPDRLTLFKHYIITFQDSMFECIAKDYIEEYSKKSMGEVITASLPDIIDSS